MNELTPQALRDEYAQLYLALQDWMPRTPDQVIRKRRLLNAGVWIGRAVQTGQMIPVYVLKEIVTLLAPMDETATTVQGVMRSWMDAARGLMQGSSQLHGFEWVTGAGPWVLLGIGVGWIWYARKKKNKTR